MVPDRYTTDQRPPFQDVRSGRWETEINMVWTTISKKLGWKHRGSKISELEATGAILQFLRATDIGKIKNGALKLPIPDWDDDGVDDE